MKEKLLKWIAEKRRTIICADELEKDGIEVNIDELELDEGEQMQLQLLDELEEMIKENKGEKQ